MVHQTMSTSNTSAPSASSKSKAMIRRLVTVVHGLIVGTLVACGGAPVLPPQSERTAAATPPVPTPKDAAAPPAAVLPTAALPAALVQPRSRWSAVHWVDLPGWSEDPLHDAWNAWLQSCGRPGPVFASTCADVRRLSLGSDDERRAWIMERFQPYRVEAVQGGDAEGLLTAYFEPVLDASRRASASFFVPVYQPPAGLLQGKPWYSRREIDTQASVQALLKGREIAFLADPVDALILQIQGSGRLRVTEPDGTQRLVRVAYAGSNNQPYASVGKWLLDQGAVREASWPGIRAWVARNPGRVNEMLWSNPRTVFFREEPLSTLDAGVGPRGAQGVALTPGRSIAVDPLSIPYGTPVWLVSSGAAVQLNKLVLAQDTGSAIVGAVRADYFVGWEASSADLAGRLKQSLRLWVLWPKQDGPR